jgi:hypothetical protein
MADTAGLPSMPSTADMAGGGEGAQGDPLAIMRGAAKQNIESVNKNSLPNDKEKIEFKKYVLKKLQSNINKFTELDTQAAQKAEKEAATAETDEAKTEEEDPFADIFGEEEGEQDETNEEKMKIVQEFISDLKITKEKFLKEVRIKREKQQAKTDEKNMKEILGKLDEA